MSKLIEIGAKICRKWMKMRLQPIRVYCLHHVCAEFDEVSMNISDWMQIDEFKEKIKVMLRDGVEFISLTDAYSRICNDRLRCKRYAVLTFDDGYASLKEILPWLEEQHIPATLFINGKYLDGKSYRKNLKEKYLTQNDLFTLTSPLIEIGSHGWEHIDTSDVSIDIFKECLKKNNECIRSHPRYVQFYAYAYGRFTIQEDRYLHSLKQIPVLIDANVNYNDRDYIHRELLK